MVIALTEAASNVVNAGGGGGALSTPEAVTITTATGPEVRILSYQGKDYNLGTGNLGGNSVIEEVGPSDVQTVVPQTAAVGSSYLKYGLIGALVYMAWRKFS